MEMATQWKTNGNTFINSLNGWAAWIMIINFNRQRIVLDTRCLKSRRIICIAIPMARFNTPHVFDQIVILRAHHENTTESHP